MRLDEKTLMLLQMIVLYSHDRLGLAEPEKVSAFQVGSPSVQGGLRVFGESFRCGAGVRA